MEVTTTEALRKLKVLNNRTKIIRGGTSAGKTICILLILIDYAIKILMKHKSADLITNIFPRTYPSGQSVEIIKTKILHDNISSFSPHEKEHVTSYFYLNNKKFKIINFKKKINTYKNFPKLSIDYKSDLKKVMKSEIKL